MKTSHPVSCSRDRCRPAAALRTLVLTGLLLTMASSASGQFSYPDFSAIPDLLLLGTAQQNGARIDLTQSLGDQIGGFYRLDPQPVADGFETVFRFQVSNDGADGFTFIIQNDSDTALSTASGSTLGYATAPLTCYTTMTPGIPSSLVVEFDTWDSGPCFAEPGAARHIAVHSNGLDPNTGQWDERLGGLLAPAVPNFEDGAVHTARIVYDATVPILRVYLDDLDTPLFDSKVDLGALLQTTNAWVGFTGTTGGVTSTFSLLEWNYTPIVPLTYDDCTSAIDLVAGDICAFDTTFASNDGPAPGCGTGTPTDVWFRHTPVCSGDVMVSLCGSAFDTVVAVYEGPACPATTASLVACNDNACGSASEVAFSANAGTTYFIQVAGSGGATGPGSIELTQLTGTPLNETCGGAFVYTGGVSDSTSCASAEGIDPGCNGGAASPDVWYEYTATQDSLVTVSLAGSSFDTVVGIWSGCPVPGDAPLYCNDNGLGTGTASEITFQAAAGEVFLVQVLGAFGASGLFFLEITEFVPPDLTDAHVIIDGDTGGMIDSTTALEAALASVGVTPVVIGTADSYLGTPGTIYFVGGTYPANTPLAQDGLGDRLRMAVESGTDVYVSGSDIWGFDAQTTFQDVDGIDTVATADGGDNHIGARGVAGGPLDGLLLIYTQDQAASDWTDELVPTATDLLGPNSSAVLEDDGTGGGGVGGMFGGLPFPVLVLYETDPGNGTVLCGSTEFGGYDLQTELVNAMLSLLGGTLPPGGVEFRRGDVNGDGGIDVSDAVFLLASLFVPGSPTSPCADAADTNDDGTGDVSDAVFLLAALFVPGSADIPPPMDCGTDPTMDPLDCGSSPNCP